MASSSLAPTGMAASTSTVHQQQHQHAMTTPSNGSSPAPSVRPSAPVSTVAIRNGKTIGINDHIYISQAYAPGAGEPYIIARVMEFVTAASSRSGAAALASSSGTLQVRANVYLRMRDISLRHNNDPRLLVATMHSDVYSLDNVRGICNVRHRDLIGSGSAPDVSQWKKKEDHFYYHQLYDRYIHRFYDVISTEKVKNAPPEVLSTLRNRYSFVVAELGMMTDLCDALRGCAVCHRWAASVESVRCDTCKKFFHMKCLNPPLASKPAKGYSWTCAPCSKRHEQDVGHALATGGTITTNGAPNGQGLVRAAVTAAASRGRGAATGSGRGRGRGGAVSARRALKGQDDAGTPDQSPDSSPAPEKTIDDIRGTRCFGRWPYRYFGQHTRALDVLDPHDSVYPIATTRLGVKYQAVLPSWQEQQAAGLGVHFRAKGGKDEDGNPIGGEEGGEAAATGPKTVPIKRGRGRPPKRKRGGGAAAPITEHADRSDSPMTAVSTPTMVPAALPSEPPEFERGTDQSVQPIILPSIVSEERQIDVYLKAVVKTFDRIPPFNVDLLDRALMLLTEHGGNMITALQALSSSKPEDLRIVSWSSKELKAFETAMKECSSDMRQLKKRIPTKRYSDIVRQFVVWKTQRLNADLRAQTAESGAQKSSSSTSAPAPSSRLSASRAVSPSLSVFGDNPPSSSRQPRSCSMCSTASSEVWYKGPIAWPNRSLCINCGLYWRKYAAEAHNTELVSVNTRHKTANAASTAAALTSTAAEENGVLGVAPFHKLNKSRDSGGKAISAANGAVASNSSRRKIPALPCVICAKLEPESNLAQCQSCTLSVHQACFGLDDNDMDEATAGAWFCETCENEETLDAALVPRCILCSKQAQDDAFALCVKRAEETMAAANKASDAAAATAASTAAAATPLEKPKRGRPSLETQRAKAAAAAAAAAAVAEAENSKQLSSMFSTSSPPLGPLDAFKPTECNNWVHVFCALFTPEAVFSDPTRLKTVEGCGNLPTWRYESTCSLCGEQTGSCVTCAETSCKRTFHVSCAVNRSDDFIVGLELAAPSGKSKKAGVESVTFRGETGVMSAVIYCREHRQGGATTGKGGAKMFGLADVDVVSPGAANGDAAVVGSSSTSASVEPFAAADEAKTALQVYAETYKHIGAVVSGQGSSNAASSVVAHMTESSYALLRRAKRFDLLFSSSDRNHLPASSMLLAGGTGKGGHQQARAVTATPAPVTSSLPSNLDLKIGLHIGSSSSGSSGAAKGLGLTYFDEVDGDDDEEEECCRCHTKTSPFWWTVPASPPADGEARNDEGFSGSGSGSGTGAPSSALSPPPLAESATTNGRADATDIDDADGASPSTPTVKTEAHSEIPLESSSTVVADRSSPATPAPEGEEVAGATAQEQQGQRGTEERSAQEGRRRVCCTYCRAAVLGPLVEVE